MRKRKKLFWFLFAVFVGFFLCACSTVLADEVSDKFNNLQNQISDLEKKLEETRGQKQTLSSQIAYMNQQIQIAQLKINQTQAQISTLEEEIDDLSLKIDRLDVSLDKLSQLLLCRVVETYKKGQTEPALLLFAADDMSQFLTNYRYLQEAQKHDKALILAVQEARNNFDAQKTLKEEKQAELEKLRAQLQQQNNLLAQQKADKEHLLAVTKSNEALYQQMLANALAELQAIQAIVAGRGEEKEVGAVKQGEKIATVIQGKSSCSTGTHLHFEVREGSGLKNPFSYLSPTSLTNDSGGDEYFFGGDWPWPLSGSIRLTQGFGNTWWVRSGGANYPSHTGIDIVSDNSAVAAVKEGTLYNGSIKCGGGNLFYVRVDHADSGLDTYYLHVNYAKL
ncbi:hypothetical protein KBI33_00755 [Candidatus Shapirobacteria bacterium]|nr:hypothetical protein [Candidatus Shapirobacteria bacterium]